MKRMPLPWFFLLIAIAALSCNKEPLAKESSAQVFQRQKEPNENAFTVLVPKGWKVEGGIFNVNPAQAGGPGNSMEPKCDLTVKNDNAGTVLIRWLPSYNYADLSGSPGFAHTAGFFPPGSSYQGMEVRSMPKVNDFLMDTFKKLHPRAKNVKVTQKEPLPELATIFRKLTQSVNNSMAKLGLPPITFTSGGLVIEYAEGNVRYKEAIITALADARGGAASWSNQYTLEMRAPLEEADKWKPVLDIIRQSIEINPRWLAAVQKAAAQRGQVVQDTMKHIQRIDKEIYENRQKTRSDIQHENYLVLTEQDEYVNPFTKKVEQDSSAYEYRWTTSDGDRIYTDESEFDPNRVDEHSHVDWKLTPVRKR